MRALGEHFVLHRLDLAPDKDALIEAVAPVVRAVVVGGQATAGAELFARLPALEIVANLEVGCDTVDTTEAARRGIVVTNTPDVATDEVADLAVGLLLATVRRIPQADRRMRAGCWIKGPFPLSHTLRGRTVGILGLGRIGQAIATRLEGFGVTIAYHARRRRPAVAYAFHDTVLGLAQACVVLIVVAPGDSGTRHLVDAGVLAALGPDGILVNVARVARGTLVDEAALTRALHSGIIQAAGLDVFADKPRVPSELATCENTVLLPHVGSASHRTRRLMGELVVENLSSWFLGHGPVTPVPEAPWLAPAKLSDQDSSAVAIGSSDTEVSSHGCGARGRCRRGSRPARSASLRPGDPPPR